MKRSVFFLSLVIISLGALFGWQYLQFSDHKLHVVFCHVGQGDAIFIRTPLGKTILLDGGPDSSVLPCLSSHMPFWKRNIDLMILSHPHADHLQGLIPVLDRYEVGYFATEPLVNETAGYEALRNKIKEKRIRVKEVLAGDRITIEEGVVMQVLGPTQQYLDETSPKGTIGERAEFGSLIQLLSYGDFDVLFTGDSQVKGLSEAVKGEAFHRRGIEVLHVPHHGSRFGLDLSLLKKIDPMFAVISVGKNTYGHPSAAVLGMLRTLGIRFVRTDQDGDIEVISDGKKWGAR